MTRRGRLPHAPRLHASSHWTDANTVNVTEPLFCGGRKSVSKGKRSCTVGLTGGRLHPPPRSSAPAVRSPGIRGWRSGLGTAGGAWARSPHRALSCHRLRLPPAVPRAPTGRGGQARPGQAQPPCVRGSRGALLTALACARLASCLSYTGHVGERAWSARRVSGTCRGVRCGCGGGSHGHQPRGTALSHLLDGGPVPGPAGDGTGGDLELQPARPRGPCRTGGKPGGAQPPRRTRPASGLAVERSGGQSPKEVRGTRPGGRSRRTQGAEPRGSPDSGRETGAQEGSLSGRPVPGASGARSPRVASLAPRAEPSRMCRHDAHVADERGGGT